MIDARLLAHTFVSDVAAALVHLAIVLIEAITDCVRDLMTAAQLAADRRPLGISVR